MNSNELLKLAKINNDFHEEYNKICEEKDDILSTKKNILKLINERNNAQYLTNDYDGTFVGLFGGYFALATSGATIFLIDSQFDYDTKNIVIAPALFITSLLSGILYDIYLNNKKIKTNKKILDDLEYANNEIDKKIEGLLNKEEIYFKKRKVFNNVLKVLDLNSDSLHDIFNDNKELILRKN